MITLRTPQQIEQFRNKIPIVRIQLREFQNRTLLRLANEIILDEIQAQMRQHKFSRRIIDNTRITRVEHNARRIRVYIRSDYISESGFDVATAREKGTRDHWVEPKVTAQGRYLPGHTYDKAHHRPDIYGGKYQRQHPIALSWIQDGERRFSKGHMVSGMPSLRIIRKTIRDKKKKVMEQYTKELRAWVQKSMEVS